MSVPDTKGPVTMSYNPQHVGRLQLGSRQKVQQMGLVCDGTAVVVDEVRR